MNKNIKDLLIENLLEKYGDFHYSNEHGFVAKEQYRNETHAIVSYSYNFLGDAATTICRFEIPIIDWDNMSKFPTIEFYVKHNPIDCLKEFPYAADFSYDLEIGDYYIQSEIPFNKKETIKPKPFKSFNVPVRDDFELYPGHEAWDD